MSHKLNTTEIEQAIAESTLSEETTVREPGLIEESCGATFYNIKCDTCGNVFYASPGSDLDAQAIEKAKSGGTSPLVVGYRYCYVCMEWSINDSFQLQEQQLSRERQRDDDDAQALLVEEYLDSDEPSVYEVQCEGRLHTFNPERGSDLEQRAHEHLAIGYIDLLKVSWRLCPDCIRENEELTL